MRSTPNVRALARPSLDESERASTCATARRLRAERVTRLVVAQAKPLVPQTILFAFASMPSLAATQWQNVDRAIAHLATTIDAESCTRAAHALVGAGMGPRVRFGRRNVGLLAGASPLTPSDIGRQLERAAAFLAEAAPEYLRWVEDVLTDVFPIDGRDGVLRSYSSAAMPGRISVTVPASPVAIAQLLVQESSHHYFQLAREIGPTDDAPDTHGRILAAYHSRVNACAFLERCVERNMDADGYAAKNLGALRRDLWELDERLAVTPGLTDNGRTLWGNSRTLAG